MTTHAHAIVEILEAHPGDPAAAVKALEAYEAEHGAEIAEIKERAVELRKELPGSQKRTLLKRWDAQAPELERRIESLLAAIPQ